MDDKQQAKTEARELDEQALDQASGGKPPAPGTPKDGNVTGMDDWEKHNV